MQISFIRESFIKNLTLVNQVLGIKPDLPVLANVLIKADKGRVVLSGTNLESTIEVSIPTKVEKPGETTVPGRMLLDFLQGTKADQASLVFSKEELRLKAGMASAKLPTMSPQEFPTLAAFEKGTEIDMDKEDFLMSVSQTAFCAAPEEARPVLTGVLINGNGDNLELVATDGYRLGRKVIEGSSQTRVLIPARALKEAAKVVSEQPEDTLQLAISKDNNQVKISTKNTSITTRLIDGEYPSYEQIIPSSFPTTLVAEKEKLIESIRLVSLFAKDVGNVVRLTIESKGATVSANTAQVGEAEAVVEGKVSGDPLKIAFNSKFLLDALGALKSNNVRVAFSGPATAAMVEGEDEKKLMYIVMPVRTQS